MPEHAHHPPHLGKRLAPCLLDDHQRFTHLLLVGLEQTPHRGRLHRHHADAVPDHVVELARDPGPLVGDGTSRPFLTLPFGEGGPLLRLVDLAVLAADGEPDDPGDGEGDHVPREVAELPLRIVEGHQRRDADREGEARDRAAPRRTHPPPEANDKSKEERDQRMCDQPAVDERGQGDRDRDRHQGSGRVAAAGEKRRGEGQDGQNVEPQRALLAA